MRSVKPSKIGGEDKYHTQITQIWIEHSGHTTMILYTDLLLSELGQYLGRACAVSPRLVQIKVRVVKRAHSLLNIECGVEVMWS